MNAPLVPSAPMSAPTLRPYQIDLLAQIDSAFASGERGVLCQLPTGGGKTLLIAESAARAVERGEKVVIVAHRKELLEQIGAALQRLGLAYQTLDNADPENPPDILVTGVAKLARCVDRWRGKFKLLIIDEAHHAVAKSWRKIIASQPRARLIGMTATPQRLDGRGLDDLFTRLIVGPSIATLTAGGFLVAADVFEPARVVDLTGAKIVRGDYQAADLRQANALPSPASVASEYRRLADGLPSILFAADREASRDYVAALNAAGVPSRHVDGETPDAERAAALAGLADGSIKVVSNCDLFGEGIDIPSVACVILARPTASLAVHLQQVGRSLRVAGRKDKAIVLDLAGNCRRHGLPDQEHHWTLEGRPPKLGRLPKTDAPVAPIVRRCDACGTLHAAGVHACANCGASLLTPKERREIEVRLELDRRRTALEKLRHRPKPWRIAWGGTNQERLELVAESLGYKPGWAYFQRQRALALEASNG